MRCLTILLACGWFLMMPPPGSKSSLLSHPSKAWSIEDSFDTARECEAEKIAKWKKAKETGISEVAEVYLGTKCLPTEMVERMWKGN